MIKVMSTVKTERFGNAFYSWIFLTFGKDLFMANSIIRIFAKKIISWKKQKIATGIVLKKEILFS